MAFTCPSDAALTALSISQGDIVTHSDVVTIANAINEIKNHMNNSSTGYNVTIGSVNWGSDSSIIDADIIMSVRSMIDDIDPTTVCTCNYVCSNDNQCSCNSQFTT